jgi:hypothetical protein
VLYHSDHMTPSECAPAHFAFLVAEWPEVLDAARRAERLVYADARASSFYTRAARWSWRSTGCTATIAA